ncbi:uncharacterized protein LOC113771129 [Coffea eugenioides]|uniref:uncharacterized protein LOC113771129 n=1 Tax=Coffea eugenioides TaxID=49369 RepID=UPI000F610EFA|nr:uncharacterized protein LOC113771129 [Coffea eugenioides]
MAFDDLLESGRSPCAFHVNCCLQLLVCGLPLFDVVVLGIFWRSRSSEGAAMELIFCYVLWQELGCRSDACFFVLLAFSLLLPALVADYFLPPSCYLSEMDKNALRRKRYAEMSPDAKAALLCRRCEARLVKKKDKSSRSYVRSVPFGHVETGVCFFGSAPARNDQLPGCHNEVVDGCPAVLQQSLDYMSTTIPAPLCLSSGTSSSAVVPHLVQCSLVSEAPLISRSVHRREAAVNSGTATLKEQACLSPHVSATVQPSRPCRKRSTANCSRKKKKNKLLPLHSQNENEQTCHLHTESTDVVLESIDESNLGSLRSSAPSCLNDLGEHGVSSSITVTPVSFSPTQPTGNTNEASASFAPPVGFTANATNCSTVILPAKRQTGTLPRQRRSKNSRIDEIPKESLLLPDAPDCQYCGAKRFHLEPPSFCCSQGEISIVAPPMPYALKRLFIGNDEESDHFRKLARTYNNNLSFTSFAAKYDPELTRNTRGVYTFRVQGQVYHFLNSLSQPDDRTCGIHLYFFDTDEQLINRVAASDKLRESTLKLLMDILSNNPYARFFKDLRDIPDLEKHNIVLNCFPGLDQHIYNLTSTSQVAAIWTENDDESVNRQAHILVYSHSNTAHKVQHYYACYDPLQYPLLFPRGESGWHHGIKRAYKRKQTEHSCDEEVIIDPSSVQEPSYLIDLEKRAADHAKKDEHTVSAREYYCYRFQIRKNDESMLLHSLRLLQQFSVDSYVKIETSRLDFQRKRQNEIRTEILEGVLDSVSIGQTEGSKVGRKVILPASFIGGPRDMRRRYLDAMALVQKYGKPDIFLTMTCNPMWKEIQDCLQFKERAQDRPDLLSRVFRAKFEMLKAKLLDRKIFGEVAACVYVIEFQKRGFPHAHLLLILKPQFKLLNPESYDRIVSAELPDPKQFPHLYSLVLKHMVHGPCGDMGKNSPCMKGGSCKNHYPKNFCEHTTHAEDSYPYYRRRDDGSKITVRRFELDNRWIIPYNPYLLALLDCHMNVEICSTLELVKYLYKYIFKGHDLISFKIISDDSRADVDEIREFQQGRWISPPEAFWRIFEFRLNEMTPAVYTLQVHLPDQQLITFNKNSDLLQLMRKIDFSKTMLTEFFKMNKANGTAKTLKCIYREFPEHFVWSFKFKAWTERKRKRAIGRLVTVSPHEGERYYLRLLLTHVRAPTSFDNLLNVDGKKMNCFRDAALGLGLLQSDTYIQETLEEAVLFQMPSSLRLLFATILVHCSPADHAFLWNKFQLDLSADYHRSQHLCFNTPEEIRNKVLQEIKKMVEQMGKSFPDYHLAADTSVDVHYDQLTKEIECEKNIEVPAEDLMMPFKLNAEQRHAYDLILQSVFCPVGQSFFIDGPGGTGKTFLYRSLLATLRSQGYIAIAVATLGVAASILPGGRTAHSRFKIPLDFSRTKTCQISKQGSVAKLLFESKLVLWDEASMAKRETVEAFDGLLRDIMDCDHPFGGKVVIFGGDFRQTLPVIKQATKQVLIESSLPNSPLWSQLQKLQLVHNMRAILDPAFSDFLLRIGEGRETVDRHGEITLPFAMVIPYIEKEQSLNRLVESVFPDLMTYSKNPYSMINRCVLAPKNSSVDKINDMMIKRFPGNLHVYVSSDRTVDPRHQGDYQDFLNSQNPKGLPPHKLLLKENCPIMLIRNLNPTEGLCNGTRLICRELKQNTICAEIAFGQHRGKRIFLPKIPLQVSDNDKNGLPFIRTQFPVRVCFALTINKSQGQTLDYVGIYLREPVFSHGQLYVVLSRVKTSAALKVLILPGTFDGIKTDCRTRNVVFEEILRLTKH